LLERTLGDYWTQMVFVFAEGGERPGTDVRGRMFAPTIDVPEDPATGSACAALGGYLAARDETGRDRTRRW
ncbi:PhzF family phenazine biosynthesis protein, partial [Salmonella enterica subsp. enterica serovar Minnesota]|uniref:PhzF family phenazine biosynthesis protein n=1 Tax=Salmonella enterica TaxID=28901 RepID=UPI003D2C989E